MLLPNVSTIHLRFIDTGETCFGEKIYTPADRATWTNCMIYTKNKPLFTSTEKELPPIESLKIAYSKIAQIAKMVNIISSKVI